MADINLYFPKEKNLEGIKFENDPSDLPTKFGLTIDDIHEFNIDENGDGVIDWRDVRDLTDSEALNILKKLYWDYFKADQIKNQLLGEFIVDSGLHEGRRLIAKYTQSILGLSTDGLVGDKTVSAINSSNAHLLFLSLRTKRIERYDWIVANYPNKKKYYDGWINRANAIFVP